MHRRPTAPLPLLVALAVLGVLQALALVVTQARSTAETAAPHRPALLLVVDQGDLVAKAFVAPTTTVPPTTTTTLAPPITPTTAPSAPPTTAVATGTAPSAVPASAPGPSPSPPPPAPAAPVANSRDEERALELVNRERADAGLGPLQISQGARSVARAWSAHMVSTGLHHNPDLTGDLERAGVTGWRIAGENVGRGGDIGQIHAAFMASRTHRDNILKGAYSHVGIGVVRSGSTVWITMDFVGY